MNAELYFVARFKRGDFLFLTHGPFIEQDEAEATCEQQEKQGACYSKVIKVTLPFEVIDNE